jgi:adenosyl cobinamide kinase/adenosyl cobinamide phosphate guanylyltransferase
VLFKEGKVDSSAQIHSFEDTWEWTEETVRLFDELKKHPNPKIAILIHSLAEFIGYNEMMASTSPWTGNRAPSAVVRVVLDRSCFAHDPMVWLTTTTSRSQGRPAERGVSPGNDEIF